MSQLTTKEIGEKLIEVAGDLYDPRFGITNLDTLKDMQLRVASGPGIYSQDIADDSLDLTAQEFSDKYLVPAVKVFRDCEAAAK